ncbi:hypothetical protein HU200_025861 [Digitaria exilis]|uniref:Aminotransferase-like plant mobile domain-containing protein n=1 Tax=Digitaria exilis TaxID=1010633 RepID=A0A835BWL7_9POAL|nr:hypothetical protein HU200_025861 [Digitaria exilis]
MVEMLDKLTKSQEAIVRDLGLGPILALKCTDIPTPLVLLLATYYDPASRSVKLPNGASFRIDAITSHLVLGIPYGGIKVPTKSSNRAKAVILKDTNQSNQAAKLNDLMSMINRNLEGDKFARIFMLIVLGIFLCPSSSSRVSHRYYEAISVVSNIKTYDWSSAVADCMHNGILSFHSNTCKGNITGKATLSGCSSF